MQALKYYIHWWLLRSNEDTAGLSFFLVLNLTETCGFDK